MAKQPLSLPKTLGACADRLYLLREQRLKVQKQADLLAEEEAALKDHIIQKLPKSEASGVAGKVARVAVQTKEVPSVDDWPKLHAFIKKTGQFELLGRTVSKEAIRERWEAGVEVPGVKKFKAVTINLNKL